MIFTCLVSKTSTDDDSIETSLVRSIFRSAMRRVTRSNAGSSAARSASIKGLRASFSRSTEVRVSLVCNFDVCASLFRVPLISLERHSYLERISSWVTRLATFVVSFKHRSEHPRKSVCRFLSLISSSCSLWSWNDSPRPRPTLAFCSRYRTSAEIGKWASTSLQACLHGVWWSPAVTTSYMSGCTFVSRSLHKRASASCSFKNRSISLLRPSVNTPSMLYLTNSLQYLTSTWHCVRSAMIQMGITLNKSTCWATVLAAMLSSVTPWEGSVGKDVPTSNSVCSLADATPTARYTPGTCLGVGWKRTPSCPKTLGCVCAPHVNKWPWSVTTAVWCSDADTATAMPPPFWGSIPVTSWGDETCWWDLVLGNVPMDSAWSPQQ